MREFNVPVTFNDGGREKTLLSMTTGPSHGAEEFLRDAFITEPVSHLLDLFRIWKGMGGEYRAFAFRPDVLAFEIDPVLLDRPWMLAAMVGVIDSATWLQDEEDPFITNVNVVARHLPGVTIEDALLDMDEYARNRAEALHPMLGEGYLIDGVPRAVWPADARNYFFEIAIPTVRSPDGREIQRVHELFALIERAMSASAFETALSAEEMFDEGLIPFPVEVTVLDAEIRYQIEGPPSDLSIPLAIASDVLGRNIADDLSTWRANLREAW